MTRKCTASGDGWVCNGPHKARGLCGGHWSQWKRNPQAPLTPLKVLNKVERYDPSDMLCRIPKGHQRCTGCSKILPFAAFAKSKRDKSGITQRCRDCDADKHLDFKYGLGASVWVRYKLLDQGHRCAACLTDTPGAYGWHLDHDHDTGEWRDMLCAGCNFKLGIVEQCLHNQRMNDWLRTRHGIAITARPARQRWKRLTLYRTNPA